METKVGNIFGERLASLRKQMALSQKGLGDKVGVSDAAIAKYEKKGTMPALDVAARIAQLGNVSLDWLIGNSDEQADEATAEKTNIQIPALLDDDGMLPVLGTAAGSAIGSIAISGEAIDWVRRPIGLRGAKDAYGLYVTGISMEPRFKTGELVFIHPHRPIRAGDDVIFQTHDKHSDVIISFIKEYVRETEDRYIAKQYNPKATVEYLKGNVHKLHRVMRLNELVGV